MMWYDWSAAAVVFAFIGLNILAYRNARTMLKFVSQEEKREAPETLTLARRIKILIYGARISRPRSDLRPTQFQPKCTSLRIPVGRGIMLGAWSCVGLPQAPLVILFHGYRSDKTNLLTEAGAFCDFGFSVLLVDFRGSGDSSEAYTTIGYEEAEDVAAAVNFARENLLHQKIILYGQSMGAAAILRSISHWNVQPSAVIVEAVFDRMLNTVRNRFNSMHVPSFPSAELLVFWGGYQARFNGFRHNPTDYARRVKCPILFLHGTDDPRARLEEGRRVFAAVEGPKQFHEFAGLRHESSLARFPSEWKETVGHFLKEIRDCDFGESDQPSKPK